MCLFYRVHSNVIGMAADSWLTIMDRFLILGDESADEKAEMKQKMLELIDIYYDALDAPKKGAKVYLPNELRPDIFPHYMERDKKFKSTSILGLIYDFVQSQTTKQPSPPSGKGLFLLLLHTVDIYSDHQRNHNMCFTCGIQFRNQ